MLAIKGPLIFTVSQKRAYPGTEPNGRDSIPGIEFEGLRKRHDESNYDSMR